eukprot:evm.model.scf_240EXC.4 EVM.evm.TU.scf_240EXC.4   scf_240EXC:63489-74491(+)
MERHQAVNEMINVGGRKRPASLGAGWSGGEPESGSKRAAVEAAQAATQARAAQEQPVHALALELDVHEAPQEQALQELSRMKVDQELPQDSGVQGWLAFAKGEAVQECAHEQVSHEEVEWLRATVKRQDRKMAELKALSEAKIKQMQQDFEAAKTTEEAEIQEAHRLVENLTKALGSATTDNERLIKANEELNAANKQLAEELCSLQQCLGLLERGREMQGSKPEKSQGDSILPKDACIKDDKLIGKGNVDRSGCAVDQLVVPPIGKTAEFVVDSQGMEDENQ